MNSRSSERGPVEKMMGNVDLWLMHDRGRQLNFAHRRQQLTAILGRYCSRSICVEDITNDAWGKPHLMSHHQKGNRQKGDRQLQINFSTAHTSHLSLYAVSSSVVGVDIEEIVPLDNVAGLAQTCLSEREYQQWSDGPANSADFLRFWTIKEAVLKASGHGFLRMEPREVEVADAPELPVAHDGKQWQIVMPSLSGHVAALAVDHDGPVQVRWRALSENSENEEEQEKEDVDCVA